MYDVMYRFDGDGETETHPLPGVTVTNIQSPHPTGEVRDKNGQLHVSVNDAVVEAVEFELAEKIGPKVGLLDLDKARRRFTLIINDYDMDPTTNKRQDFLTTRVRNLKIVKPESRHAAGEFVLTVATFTRPEYQPHGSEGQQAGGAD